VSIITLVDTIIEPHQRTIALHPPAPDGPHRRETTLVEILPRFSSKRQAVDISQQIESDISAYLVTITIMNAIVGIVTAAVMWPPVSATISFGERSPSC
jgi:hypothetical protein